MNNSQWLFEQGMAWQKERIKELEAEVERLREENERLGGLLDKLLMQLLGKLMGI